jgi:sterol 3beta-glucosyltransferase
MESLPLCNPGKDTAESFGIGPFPHDRLFEHGKLIAHHCGFGIMTTALSHGKPSIAIPHLVDQPAWAERLYGLKLCPRPIPAKKLSKSLLMAAIRACAEDNKIRKNSAAMGKRMRTEGGLKRARELIEDFVLGKIAPSAS